MGVIGDIAGAIIGGNASKKAAKAQEKSTQRGIAEISRQYDLTRQDFAPWRAEGATAIGKMGEMLKPGYDHTTSPGYEFRLGEGMRTVENSAAAKGILQSGGTLKGLMRYGQGVAAEDFNDQFNRQASVAAGGQQVNTTLGALGAQKAGGIAELFTQGGNAKASGYVGQANAWINGISNFDNRLQNMMKIIGGGR